MRFPFAISAAAEFDVVGFGTNAVDHLIQVREYPAFGSKIEFLRYAKDAGGEAATTLVGLQRLGLRTAYAGRFGDDAEGELGLKSLADEGVDTTFAERVAGAPTQTAFILIDQKTGERTIIWHRDQKLAYEADEAPVAAAAGCRVLHMTPHDVDACIRMARSARDKGAVISVDVDNVFDGLDSLLPLIDVLLTSNEFPQAMTGHHDHKTAMRAIQERYGCAIVGATLGRAGSIILCNGATIETPAFNVPGGCVDTTGAGDAFRTGFLYGMLSGEEPQESARTANAVAALSCRAIGARSGLPRSDELTMLVK